MRFPDNYPPDEPMPPPEPPKVDDQTAADMAALGMTLDDVLKRFRAHREQQALFDSDVKAAAHLEDTRATATDPLMPPTITGFHDAVMASREPANKAYLDSIPLSHRETYARDWEATQKHMSHVLATAEYQARGQYELEQIDKTVERNTALAASNPLHTDTLIYLSNRQIDNASSIESGDKTALKEDAEIKLRTAQLVALHGHDADEMRRQLGVADPLALAEAASSSAPTTPATDTEAAASGAAVSSSPVGVPSTGIAAGVARPAATTRASTADAGPSSTATAIDSPTPATEAPSQDDPAAATTGSSANPVGTAADAPKLPVNFMSAVAAPKLQSPAQAAAAPVNPIWGPIPQSARPGLVNQATVRQAAAQGAARVDLEDRLDSIKNDLTSTGRTSQPLPTSQDFALAYGLLGAGPQYASFQDIVKVGAAIDSIKTLNHDQLTGLIASRMRLAANGEAAAEDFKTLSTAAAINQQKRLDDPAGYTGATFGIDPVGFTSEDPATVKRTIAAQKLHQDQLGIPVEAQKLLPKTIARQTVDTFNNTQRSPDERISSVLHLLTAAPNPQARAILVSQLIEAGLPDTVASAVSAFNRSKEDADAQNVGVRLLKAATRRPAPPADPSKPVRDMSPYPLKKVQDAAWMEMHRLGMTKIIYGLDRRETEEPARSDLLAKSEPFRNEDRDARLLTADVQDRLADGEDFNKAVTAAGADLYGSVKHVQSHYADVILNQSDNEDQFNKGTYALLPTIEERERKRRSLSPPSVGSQDDQQNPATLVYDGHFRNARGGDLTNNFVFVSNLTDKPLTDSKGRPFIYTRAQIIQAGELADKTQVTVPAGGMSRTPRQESLSRVLQGKYRSDAKDQGATVMEAITQLPLAISGVGEAELVGEGGIAAIEATEALVAGTAVRAGEAAAESGALVSEVGDAAANGAEAGLSEGVGAASEGAESAAGADASTEGAAAEPLVGSANDDPLNTSQILKGSRNPDGSPNFAKASESLSNRIKATIRNGGNAEIYPGNDAIEIVDVEPTGELVDAHGGKWNPIDLVKKKDQAASVVKLKPAQRGGLHEDLEPWEGYERHHMPSNKTSPYSTGKGPAIAMTKEDHYLTLSWGRRKMGDAFRSAEKSIYGENKGSEISKDAFEKAMQLSIDDIRALFGNKYDEAIAQMKEASRIAGYIE